jgi:hypothetical protein
LLTTAWLSKRLLGSTIRVYSSAGSVNLR